MSRSSSGIHYKRTEKDEKPPLKGRFPRVADTAGQRLRTDFPELRHFFIPSLCSVAPKVSRHAEALACLTTPPKTVEFVRSSFGDVRENKKQEVKNENLGRFVQAKVGKLTEYTVSLSRRRHIAAAADVCVFSSRRKAFGRKFLFVVFMSLGSSSVF